jgi:hypothetical protein
VQLVKQAQLEKPVLLVILVRAEQLVILEHKGILVLLVIQVLQGKQGRQVRQDRLGQLEKLVS